ncbi:MAG: hypothetical protein P4M05_07960 [Bradyrhizobium sp.]|nr:hypothetical protein [Bradyrhizobium sp.]
MTPTRVLVLDTLDLHALMDRQPALAARIEEAAREELGHPLDAQGGDLVTEQRYDAPPDQFG